MGEPVVTTAKILGALREQYPRKDGWVTATEVVSADKQRRADFMAWNTWDGRVHVAEIKMSRGDWLHERETPGKSGAFSYECDSFWLAAAPDVVKKDELPEPWGLVLVQGSGEVVRKPGRRLGGHPSHELATAFIRRLLANDTVQDLLAQEREVAQRELKNKLSRERPAATYTKADLDNAYRRGESAERRRWKAKERKAAGGMS